MTKILMRSLEACLSSPPETRESGRPAIEWPRFGVFRRFINKLSAAVALLLILGMGLLVSGCADCKPGKPHPIGKYNIQLNLDASLNDASVAVDIVGVTPLTKDRWENYSMTKYWQPGDEMRQGADKITFTMGNGAAASQTLGMDNAKWKDWLAAGVTHVLVLADLPGVMEDKTGNLDARRQVLPLDKCTWAEGTTNLVINIKRSGLEVGTLVRTAQ